MKTSELTGAALDWAVAKCEGAGFHYVGEKLCVLWSEKFDVQLSDYSPSTDWAQGGRIIEREGISLLYLYVTDDPFRWAATQKPTMKNVKPDAVYGPTLLIAAMRCFVASKLGDEVDVPEELR